MRDPSALPFEQRPVVALFANPNPLSVSLVETLFANLSRVKVISKDKAGWELSTSHLNKGRSLEFIDSVEKKIQDTPYVVFISTCFDEKSSRQDAQEERNRILKALHVAEENLAKTLLIFPLGKSPCSDSVLPITQKAIKRPDLSVGLVYVGELFGPRMYLTEENLTSRMLKDFLLKKTVRLTKENSVLFPAYLPDTSREIVKNIFSFGHLGRRLAIFSEKVSSRKFFNLLQRINSETSHKFQEISFAKMQEFDKKAILRTNLEKALKETVGWFSEGRLLAPKAASKPKKKRPKRTWPKPSIMPTALKASFKDFPKMSSKWTWGAVGLFIFFILSPFLFLFISASSLYLGARVASTGNLKVAEKSLSFSRNASSVTQRQASLFSQAPLVGRIFIPVARGASLLGMAGNVGFRLIVIASNTRQFAKNVLLDAPFDPSAYSKKIALDLDALYKDAGFLESEIEEADRLVGQSIERALGGIGIADFRNKIFFARQVIEEMPAILGAQGERTYLVLFQNNMELRPTGGFIGSFALVTFNQGRLTGMSVQDVYSADGQLKGYVEPPEPIKNYLGEANWFLRDSNWDPDFPTTATRAEWFLEKEIDKSVDGVVGIDLEFARELVRETGPIDVADFGQEINYQNLYEVVQYEAEKDFFPGSYKKTNFLTAMARELLTQLTELESGEYLPFFKVAYKSLEEKHIQVFLHDKKAQRAISSLGWEGGVYQPRCTGNCFSDWLGIVEANVGVNKANYYLKRNAALTIVFEDGQVIRNLSVFLKNNTNPALGPAARYKTYLRVIAPQAAVFRGVKLSFADKNEILEPEINEIRGHKEAGVLVEVGPGQAKSVTFSWGSPFDASFSQKGEYRLFWRKQAGTDEDPIVIKFFFPQTLNLHSNLVFSLTEGASVGYNTTLSRDFVSRIFW